MNYINQINGFWEKVNNGPGLRTSSGFIYLALLQRNNKHNWIEEFTVDYEVMMNMTNVSKNTYYECLKELQEKGFIKYRRSENRALLGKISILPLYQNLVHEKDTNLDTNRDTSLDSSSTLNKQVNSKPKTNKQFIPPSVDDVCQYFEQKGFTKESAQKAFEYYEAGDWKDRDGKQVRNWQQKMNGVWFKDENRTKNGSTSKMVY